MRDTICVSMHAYLLPGICSLCLPSYEYPNSSQSSFTQYRHIPVVNMHDPPILNPTISLPRPSLILSIDFLSKTDRLEKRLVKEQLEQMHAATGTETGMGVFDIHLRPKSKHIVQLHSTSIRITINRFDSWTNSMLHFYAMCIWFCQLFAGVRL